MLPQSRSTEKDLHDGLSFPMVLQLEGAVRLLSCKTLTERYSSEGIPL